MRRRRRYALQLGADPLAAEPRGREGHDRLIPMINIIFLLLTFFLIAGTLRVGDALQIEPPQILTDGNIEPRHLVLSVEANGALHFQGEAREASEAIAAIKTAMADKAGEQLYIKADHRTPASVILPLLQELEKNGLGNIRLIAVKKRE